MRTRFTQISPFSLSFFLSFLLITHSTSAVFWLSLIRPAAQPETHDMFHSLLWVDSESDHFLVRPPLSDPSVIAAVCFHPHEELRWRKVHTGVRFKHSKHCVRESTPTLLTNPEPEHWGWRNIFAQCWKHNVSNIFLVPAQTELFFVCLFCLLHFEFQIDSRIFVLTML